MKLILFSLLFVSSVAVAANTPQLLPINRVYKADGQTVGSVGSAGQIKAGHVLTAKSFPAAIQADNTKLSFWNLSNSLNDSFTGGRNWTAPNSFSSATGIYGSSGEATSFAGGNQYLLNTSSFMNPGDVDFTVGGWFYATDWTNANRAFFAQSSNSSTDLSFALYVRTDSSITVYASTNRTAWDVASGWAFPHGVPAATAGWHHVALRYTAASNTLNVFFDGKMIGSATMSGNLIASATSQFYVATNINANFFTCSVDEFFATANYAMTNADIAKLYSTRLDHNKNMIAKRQDWHFKHQHLGTAGNPYQTLPFVWHDPTDANSLFVDFSDLDATDKVDIRMYDLQQ